MWGIARDAVNGRQQKGRIWMLDLSTVAGLPLGLDGRNVVFSGGLAAVETSCRRLVEARYAFADEAALGMDELYCMYRDVARDSDRETLAQHGLRFDLTLIPPGLVGHEYNKTVGHYHPVKSGTTCTYPEVYEVLHGEATYLLQRGGKMRGAVEDVFVCLVKPGEKLVIPPGYGHITINGGALPLVMANWVAREFSSVYGEIRELQGGAYYLQNREGGPQWTLNPRYITAPPLRYVAASDYLEFGLVSGAPMYALIRSAPEKLRFLTHPEEFVWRAI